MGRSVIICSRYLSDHDNIIKGFSSRHNAVPSRELFKVVFTEDKVREKGGRVCLSVLCVFTPFSLERVGSKQGKHTLFKTFRSLF